MKRLFAALLSAALLLFLFAQTDRQALGRNLAATRWDWFGLAAALFVPQTLIISWRWKRLVSAFIPLPLFESISQVLAGSTLNLVLPSKMGDLAKGYFLKRQGALDLARAMSIVIFEKLLDVAMLAAFMLAGIAAMLLRGGATPLQLGAAAVAGTIGAAAVCAVTMLYFVPARLFPGFQRLLNWMISKPRLRKLHKIAAASHDAVELLQSRGAKRFEIVFFTALIWALHLGQIYAFFRSVEATPTFGEFASMVPLAIFIGLLPISLAGFGARDAALVVLFPQISNPVMLAAALYVNLRYVIPAIAGIPFFNKYLRLIVLERK